jgi:hypothetical protein
VRAVAAHIAALPKENSARPRTVIITQGAEPVIVVTGADRQVQGCGSAFISSGSGSSILG